MLRMFALATVRQGRVAAQLRHVAHRVAQQRGHAVAEELVPRRGGVDRLARGGDHPVGLQQDATARGETTQALVQELSLRHAHPELRLPPAVAGALGVRRLDAALLGELLGALSPRWHAAAAFG